MAYGRKESEPAQTKQAATRQKNACGENVRGNRKTVRGTKMAMTSVAKKEGRRAGLAPAANGDPVIRDGEGAAHSVEGAGPGGLPDDNLDRDIARASCPNPR